MGRRSPVPCTAWDAHRLSLTSSGLNLLTSASPSSQDHLISLPHLSSSARLDTELEKLLVAFLLKLKGTRFFLGWGLVVGTKVSERIGLSLPLSIIRAENYQGSDGNKQ